MVLQRLYRVVWGFSRVPESWGMGSRHGDLCMTQMIDVRQRSRFMENSTSSPDFCSVIGVTG